MTTASATPPHRKIYRLPLMQTYLKEIGSGLYGHAANMPLVQLARQMNLLEGGDDLPRPRNVGILFFNDSPERFMPGTQIDVVIFPLGPAGKELIETTLRGPIHEQIRDALRYIQNNVIREKVIKHANRAEATRFFNYPLAAIEEALVNAVYHRGYDRASRLKSASNQRAFTSSAIPVRIPRFASKPWPAIEVSPGGTATAASASSSRSSNLLKAVARAFRSCTRRWPVTARPRRGSRRTRRRTRLCGIAGTSGIGGIGSH